MADICKCNSIVGNIICPVREKCYRYTAKADEYQSFFVDAPIKDGKCEYYWGENAENIFNELKEIVKDGIK
jgi:hypothetical protein